MGKKRESLGTNPDISKKYKMADISKEVANALKPAKKEKKKKENRIENEYRTGRRCISHFKGWGWCMKIVHSLFTVVYTGKT